MILLLLYRSDKFVRSSAHRNPLLEAILEVNVVLAALNQYCLLHHLTQSRPPIKHSPSITTIYISSIFLNRWHCCFYMDLACQSDRQHVASRSLQPFLKSMLFWAPWITILLLEHSTRSRPSRPPMTPSSFTTTTNDLSILLKGDTTASRWIRHVCQMFSSLFWSLCCFTRLRSPFFYLTTRHDLALCWHL